MEKLILRAILVILFFWLPLEAMNKKKDENLPLIEISLTSPINETRVLEKNHILASKEKDKAERKKIAAFIIARLNKEKINPNQRTSQDYERLFNTDYLNSAEKKNYYNLVLKAANKKRIVEQDLTQAIGNITIDLEQQLYQEEIEWERHWCRYCCWSIFCCTCKTFQRIEQ